MDVRPYVVVLVGEPNIGGSLARKHRVVAGEGGLNGARLLQRQSHGLQRFSFLYYKLACPCVVSGQLNFLY